jgi:uncharacterized protein (DUF433 family)
LTVNQGAPFGVEAKKLTLSLMPEMVPLAADADGSIRVAKTRVTLDTVIAAFEAGMTAEAIVEQYPVLRLADVYAVIAYYLHHIDEVTSYLEDRERLSETVREESERHFDPAGVRARLLARQKPQ